MNAPCGSSGVAWLLLPLLLWDADDGPPLTGDRTSFRLLFHLWDRNLRISSRISMVVRRCHGVSEGSSGVVSDTVRELQRCEYKGHVIVLSGRLGVLCHHTSLQTGANVSNRPSNEIHFSLSYIQSYMEKIHVTLFVLAVMNGGWQALLRAGHMTCNWAVTDRLLTFLLYKCRTNPTGSLILSSSVFFLGQWDLLNDVILRRLQNENEEQKTVGRN